MRELRRLLPVVGAEGLRGEAVFVEEVRPRRVATPGVADGGWLRHGGAGNNDAVAFDCGVGPVEFLIGAGEHKALEFFAVPRGEALSDVRELDADLVAFDLV